jgi:prephenate dehydrogenase
MLFEDSVFCIMPSAALESKAVQTTVALGKLLGAEPYFIDVHEYDSLVQGVETLPGLSAAAMFHSVTETTGWRDILRFADFPFTISTRALDNEDLAKLALTDPDATIRWLDAYLDGLQLMKRLIAEGDEERLVLVLDTLLIERERWLDERKKNDWTEEISAPDYSVMNVGSQLLGLGPRRKDKK